MANADKPWEEYGWKREGRLGGGGQGATYRTIRKDETGTRIGVLKLLHERKANDAKARRRMYREVTNLKSLASAGARVPNIIEANTDKFENLSVSLFLIMQHIEGKTLAEVIEQEQRLGVAESVGLAMDLCKTLRIAFREGIVHRDLKPANLIVSAMSPPEIAVVDFGLSFNDDDVSTVTEISETFDNELISLPERRGPAENKRDPRSDITGVCVLLFYCLTGCRPRNLRDSKNRPPHRWENFALTQFISSESQLLLLNAFFDRGFQYELDRRFQALDEVEQRLLEIIDPTTERPSESFATVLEREANHFYRRDRATQLGYYRSNGQKMINLLSEKLGSLQSQVYKSGHYTLDIFQFGHLLPALPHEFDNVGAIFAATIKPRAHNRDYVIVYSVGAKGPECCIYRTVLRVINPASPIKSSNDKMITLKEWTIVLRYMGDSAPDFAPIARDFEHTIGTTFSLITDDICGQTS